jgi:ketosteroid isomerase-like protein
LLLTLLAAVVRGDETAVAAALDPDVAWQGIRPEWGCDGVNAVVDTLMAAQATQADIDSIELIAAPAHAIMRVRWPLILDEEDAEFLDGIYNVFAIAEGRITRIDDFEDRAAALAAAGLPV